MVLPDIMDLTTITGEMIMKKKLALLGGEPLFYLRKTRKLVLK
jgi:hypothetical protein